MTTSTTSITDSLKLKLLLTPQQAAAAMEISIRHLWTLSICGGIPSVKLGRAVRYDPRALTAWIDAQQG